MKISGSLPFSASVLYAATLDMRRTMRPRGAALFWLLSPIPSLFRPDGVLFQAILDASRRRRRPGKLHNRSPLLGDVAVHC